MRAVQMCHEYLRFMNIEYSTHIFIYVSHASETLSSEKKKLTPNQQGDSVHFELGIMESKNALFGSFFHIRFINNERSIHAKQNQYFVSIHIN